jgi:hypothetical protein
MTRRPPTPWQRLRSQVSASNEALLRAGVLRGADAVAAWDTWRACEGSLSLDREAHSILPLVYSNLRGVAPSDLLLEQLRLPYLATWSQNQELLAAVAPHLRRLRDAGIETMLLKGAALLHLYYADYGARTMGDVDLLVRRHSVPDASRILAEAGLRQDSHRGPVPSEAILHIGHASALKDPLGRCRVDLHWSAFGESKVAIDESDVWQQSVFLDVSGVRTAVMGPTHLLLHTILHGMRVGSPSSLRWLADAAKLLAVDAARVDWEYLMRRAEASGLRLVLGEALTLLVRLLDAPVPQEVLAQPASLEHPQREVALLKARACPPNSVGALQRLHALSSAYGDLCRATGERRSSLGFVRFLQSIWGLRSLAFLPFYAVGKGVRWSFWRLQWGGTLMARRVGDLRGRLVHRRQRER